VNLKDVKSPLKGIELEAAIEKEKVQVKNISFQIADGGVKGLGAIAQLTTRPQVGFEVKAEQLNLENLLPDPNPGEPSLTGQFSGSFQGTAVGMDWPQMAPTMAGKGEVSLVNGVLLNLNILQEVFRNLSVIPGLADKLKSRLPESYEAKLSARDTVLKPIQFPIMMQQGVASVRDAQIGADTFDLRGTGSFGLNGSVEMQTFLSVDADLSKAFIGSVNELQYLTNPQGQLQIPIRISGIAPDLRVLPDLQYVASKLAVSKTQEVIGKILEKKLGGNETESQPAAEAPTEQKKPDLLGQLIQSALEGSGAFGGKQESKPQGGTT
ncbi:MAG TPA: AsmA-like C-terminal region-containing protein, partial [bacterium]|nr:AsmA-like C-terminal region-containing protein [bacterium]